MSDYFLDASALVKRYADEAGSAWIRQITDPLSPHTLLSQGLLSPIFVASDDDLLAAAMAHDLSAENPRDRD